jgi:hypothetical protein
MRNRLPSSERHSKRHCRWATDVIDAAIDRLSDSALRFALTKGRLRDPQTIETRIVGGSLA